MKVVNRNFVTVRDKSTRDIEEIKNNVRYVQGKLPFTPQRNIFIFELQVFSLIKLTRKSF